MNTILSFLRFLSLRLLSTAVAGMFLFPLLEWLLGQFWGNPDPHPLRTYLLLQVFLLLVVELGVARWRRLLTTTYRQRLETAGSWLETREVLAEWEDQLQGALFYPRQRAALLEDTLRQLLQQALERGSPDEHLERFLRRILLGSQGSPEERREAARKYLRHFVAEGITLAQLPVILRINSQFPDLTREYSSQLVQLLKAHPRYRRSEALELMEAFPEEDFLPALSRIYRKFGAPPFWQPDLLKRVLAHPRCSLWFRWLTYRNLRRRTRIPRELQALYDDLTRRFQWQKRLKPYGRRWLVSLRHWGQRPAVRWSALGVVILGLLVFLGRGAVNWSVQWFQQHEKPQLKYEAASGNYTIQVAAIKDSARAALTAGKLRRAGYYAYVLPPRTNSRYYRIRLGRFQGKTPADTLARHLVQKGVIREFYVAPWDSTRPVAP